MAYTFTVHTHYIYIWRRTSLAGSYSSTDVVGLFVLYGGVAFNRYGRWSRWCGGGGRVHAVFDVCYSCVSHAHVHSQSL